MLLSFERPIVGAFVVPTARARLRHRNGLVPTIPPESIEHVQTDKIGIPQELGRSCRLLSDFPVGDTGLPTPGLGGALVRRGAKATSAY